MVKEPDNTIRPIAFASSYLNDAEKNYSIGIRIISSGMGTREIPFGTLK